MTNLVQSLWSAGDLLDRAGNDGNLYFEAAARIEQLEALLLPDTIVIPDAWRLSPQERNVFRLLVTRPLVSISFAMDALYGHLPDPPSERVIYVLIFWLRRKCRNPDIEIITRLGTGYLLVDRERFAGGDNDRT